MGKVHPSIPNPDERQHRDYLNKALTEGDMVVHGVGGRYGGLDGPFLVKAFTPKRVVVYRPNGLGPRTVPGTNLVKVSKEANG